ncbi:amidase [Nocardioides endophyticus]|uniref:Amidase n=1 Tax=Nocardioides endophyticus TaxID=1353775 RepID=A0ABP8ZB55_9ACTN
MTDLPDLTAIELLSRLRGAEVSAREVVAAHLARIEQVNPAVNAIVTLTAERAMDSALRADERLARNRPIGRLHGLPVAHKDNIPTAGVLTTHGSPLFADNVPDQDHVIVERELSEGAITVGKTNVPELGLGSHTYNPLFGVTRNPYDLRLSSGGSSGGSAAAVATGMVPMADGSDTGGSLRNPASFCNVAALRPTAGLVPSWPDAFPFSPMSVKGPMARTTRDLAYFLSILSGPDRRSALSHDVSPATFGRSLDGDLRGYRIAWSLDLGGQVPLDPRVRAALSPVRHVLVGLGAIVEDAAPSLTEADEVFLVLRAMQMESTYGELLERRPHEFSSDAAWNIEEGRKLTGPDVGRAERLRGALFNRVRTFFERYDFLVAAVVQVPPFDAELPYPSVVDGISMGNYLEWMRSCTLVSATGCPAMSVPAAFTAEGLPVGLQLIGPVRSDSALVQAGHRIEVATGATRRRPNIEWRHPQDDPAASCADVGHAPPTHR